jgi:tetratricopeptide (TPR) repeat protein
LVATNRQHDAIAVVDDLIVRAGDAEERNIQISCAEALHEKAVALGRLRRWEDALAVDNQLLTRLDGATAKPLLVGIALTLSHKAFVLDMLGDLHGASESWGEVAARFGGEESDRLRQLVDKALSERARALASLGARAESIVLADALVTRVDEAPDSPGQVAARSKALAGKSGSLVADGRFEEALALTEELLEGIDDFRSPDLRDSAALAMINKVGALYGLARVEEAEDAFRELVRRFGAEALDLFESNASDAREPERVAGALFSKAKVLEDMGRVDEARSVLRDLIARANSNEGEQVKALVAAAHQALDEL